MEGAVVPIPEMLNVNGEEVFAPSWVKETVALCVPAAVGSKSSRNDVPKPGATDVWKPVVSIVNCDAPVPPSRPLKKS